MLNFIAFGSGSSGNCYLLYTPTDALMIDAGVGIRSLKKHLRAYGLQLEMVNNILVTHDHADHIKAVGIVSRDAGAPVYSTKLVHRGIVDNYCVRQKVPEDMVRLVEKGVPFDAGEFHVEPFAVPHDSTDCVGYEIHCQDITFTIITDAGHLTDEMLLRIERANYLVIEANHDPQMLQRGPYPQYLKDRIAGPRGHLPNDECARALAEHATPALRHVWLCHLSEENNHPELARITVSQILRDHGIIAGKDFKLDVLKRKTPSEVYQLA